MRFSSSVSLASFAFFTSAVVPLGCSKSDAVPGSPPIEADATGDDTAKADAPLVDSPVDAPVATRDPCRSGIALPTDAHFAAPGTCARAVGKAPGPLRQITFVPDGDLYGVTKDGVIVRMHDANDDGNFAADEITAWGNTGGNGNNCHVDVDDGWLYAGTPNGVARFKWSSGSAKAGEKQDVIVDEPAGGNHPLHTTHVFPDETGKGRFLYVHSGSADNASDPMSPAYDTNRSLIKRFDLAKLVAGTPFKWDDGEVVTVGLRNVVGFQRSARLGKIFGVVNGMDNVTYKGVDVHNDNPGEQVVLVEKGKQYGYPFCFTAQRVVDGGVLVPPGTQLKNEGFASPHDDAWCQANSSKPASFLQSHTAPLDLVFFDGALPTGGLPDRYRNGAFIAMHGSWDRDPATGYKVVWLPFDDAGNAPMPTSTTDATTFPYEVVFGGGSAGAPKDGGWTWNAEGQGESPRPVGVAISPIDGALYVSSDSVGWVYRLGRVR
jgi:glucose/arabinose dehydrogenase